MCALSLISLGGFPFLAALKGNLLSLIEFLVRGGLRFIYDILLYTILRSIRFLILKDLIHKFTRLYYKFWDGIFPIWGGMVEDLFCCVSKGSVWRCAPG